MERERIYRGKRLDNGEWIIGHLLTYEDGRARIVPSHTDIFCYEKDDSIIQTVAYPVAPETVGQYTEMDGENLPIFEGDIVEFFGIRSVVVRAKGAFGIQVSDIIDYDILESEIPYNNSIYCCFNDNFISLWELWWNFEQDDEPLFIVKVLGNIYDNPEVLEVKKNGKA